MKKVKGNFFPWGRGEMAIMGISKISVLGSNPSVPAGITNKIKV